MIPALRASAPHHISSQRLWGVFLKCLFAQFEKATNAVVVRSMRKSMETGGRGILTFFAHDERQGPVNEEI